MASLPWNVVQHIMLKIQIIFSTIYTKSNFENNLTQLSEIICINLYKNLKFTAEGILLEVNLNLVKLVCNFDNDEHAQVSFNGSIYEFCIDYRQKKEDQIQKIHTYLTKKQNLMDAKK